MSRFTFKLPDIGEGIAEAELVEWLVEVGDMVREDQQIAAVMTDKATVELEAPVAGKVLERGGAIGDTIRVGSPLMVFETDGPAQAGEDEDAGTAAQVETPAPAPARPAPRPEPAPAAVAPPPSPPPPQPSGQVLASPLVRRRALDLGVDLASVPHAGERVKNADLDAFLIAAKEAERVEAPRQLKDEEIPVTGMRRVIAQRMEEAKRHIPHFTYVEEIDMTEFERLRGELNAEGHGPKLTLLPLLIKAICRTLPEFPQLNAHHYDDKGVVRRFGAVHMGIAAQTDAGLMVPVVQDADRLGLRELAEIIASRAEEARKGTIHRDNLRGSTMTITSLGKLGGIAATPILNRPEVCIIGPNKIATRPVWQDGQFVPRQLMNLSISCDHRVVDGYDAAAFVQALKRRLETPALIFVD